MTLPVSQKRLKTEFEIRSLQRCTVDLLGELQTLRISDLTDCVVRVGAIAGSVMVNRCIGCTLHLAAHQIRIHESEGTSFFLLIKSKPIIEDCNALRFGEYTTMEYPNAQQHLESAGLSPGENRWWEVQDFNWLRPGPSPHYVLVKEEG